MTERVRMAYVCELSDRSRAMGFCKWGESNELPRYAFCHRRV